MIVKELYEVGSHNVKINKILKHIPAHVEYVLREREEFFQMLCISAKVQYHNYDFDHAA